LVTIFKNWQQVGFVDLGGFRGNFIILEVGARQQVLVRVFAAEVDDGLDTQLFQFLEPGRSWLGAAVEKV